MLLSNGGNFDSKCRNANVDAISREECLLHTQKIDPRIMRKKLRFHTQLVFWSHSYVKETSVCDDVFVVKVGRLTYIQFFGYSLSTVSFSPERKCSAPRMPSSLDSPLLISWS